MAPLRSAVRRCAAHLRAPARGALVDSQLDAARRMERCAPGPATTRAAPIALVLPQHAAKQLRNARICARPGRKSLSQIAVSCPHSAPSGGLWWSLSWCRGGRWHLPPVCCSPKTAVAASPPRKQPQSRAHVKGPAARCGGFALDMVAPLRCGAPRPVGPPKPPRCRRSSRRWATRKNPPVRIFPGKHLRPSGAGVWNAAAAAGDGVFRRLRAAGDGVFRRLRAAAGWWGSPRFCLESALSIPQCGAFFKRKSRLAFEREHGIILSEKSNRILELV